VNRKCDVLRTDGRGAGIVTQLELILRPLTLLNIIREILNMLRAR
jgi:hypothetical protein